MSDIVGQRRALRLAMRQRRAALPPDDQAAASMAIVARIARVPLLRVPGVVAGYRAVRGEVDIDAALALLGDAGSTVTVPRVVGEHLEFAEWHLEDPTTPGPFGIPEPLDDAVVPLARHAVILAPVVAFDRRGTRLGQGGGFYDRALAARVGPTPRIIGIAHSFQQVEEIPAEAWDIPLDAAITEDAVFEFRPGVLDPAI